MPVIHGFSEERGSGTADEKAVIDVHTAQIEQRELAVGSHQIHPFQPASQHLWLVAGMSWSSRPA